MRFRWVWQVIEFECVVKKLLTKSIPPNYQLKVRCLIMTFFFSIFRQHADDEALTRLLQTSLFLVASPILVKSMHSLMTGAIKRSLPTRYNSLNQWQVLEQLALDQCLPIWDSDGFRGNSDHSLPSSLAIDFDPLQWRNKREILENIKLAPQPRSTTDVASQLNGSDTGWGCIMSSFWTGLLGLFQNVGSCNANLIWHAQKYPINIITVTDYK